jgi:hypothetical protein
MMQQRGRPVAVCSICGAFEYQMQMINDRCPANAGGKQCKGALINALAADDWQACEQCDATGTRDGSECATCGGSGWKYLRQRIGLP